MNRHHAHSKITAAGLLVTLGIIYGDIGTSPLYVMKAIVAGQTITPDLVLGGISCIIWTLTLQTTIKYVILTLKADNKGEGGIFSLYALVRKTKVHWLVFPAIIGGAALLADGLITPSISVSSAIEGLRILKDDIPTIPIVIAIIFALFFIQQFGTAFVGKFFGPIMMVWFGMLAILGVKEVIGNVAVLKAFNPYYAYNLLVNFPGGFWLLGAVFLCTTGAEALYSDLGHCGKQNIRATWGFVKLSLILNYLGQGAWLLGHLGGKTDGLNPFFEIMPRWFLVPGIIIATLAAIVASQALISGSFTLINEAIRLNFGPKLKIVFPTRLKGQVYIPTVNWMLFIGCCIIILYFQESGAMEGAYGLSIILAMMMTTTLLVYFLYLKRYHISFIVLILVVYAAAETSFLVANMSKIVHGGWVTLAVGGLLFTTMFVWYQARRIRNRYVEFTRIDPYYTMLHDLSNDQSVPKYATNLIYLTSANRKEEIESKVFYSIFQKQPKRADVYWFVHVDVVDEPFALQYHVDELVNDKLIRVDFKLGFRVDPRINLMFRQVVEEMVKNQEIDIVSRYSSLKENNITGDFRFVVIEKFLSRENDLSFYDKFILNFYELLKTFSLPEEKAFGLDTSSVTVEKVPLIVNPAPKYKFQRV